MSISLYKLVEVKDKDGKWRLVKWHPDTSDTSHCWIWQGLSFRDYFIHNYDIRHPEPDDISEDTKRILEEEPNNPSYFFMGYNELCDIAHSAFERVWGSLVNAMNERINKSRDMFVIAILKSLAKISKPEDAEKIAVRALKDMGKDTFDNDAECEDDSLEYIKEDLYDYLGMIQELNTIRTLVDAFTGDAWIDEENIRVIMYLM